jgi:hypothetical protein
MSQSRPVSSDVRTTGHLFRFTFASGAILSFLAGIQLFVLAERTEEFFAWTIKAPLSASLFGAFYWGAVVIAVTSLTRREWARARVGLFGLVVFFWLTLATTLIHLERFHLGEGQSGARVSAWIWLVVYIVVPVFWTVSFADQRRRRGLDSPARAPMGTAYRQALLVVAVVLVGLGIVLFCATGLAADIWPWPLTPLTSRAAAAWLVGLGLVVGTMWREADHDRSLPGAALMATVAGLLLIALARYPGGVEWDRGAVYVVGVAAVGLLGIAGVVSGIRARPRDRRAAPATPAS